jgi:hypothetical protein
MAMGLICLCTKGRTKTKWEPNQVALATVTFAGVIAFLDTFEQRNYNWIYYVFLMCYTWSQGSVTFFLFFTTVIVLALGSFVPYIKANMVE